MGAVLRPDGELPGRTTGYWVLVLGGLMTSALLIRELAAIHIPNKEQHIYSPR
jgi:hypothetical protein